MAFLNEKEIVDQVRKDYEWADDLRQRYIGDWKRIHRLYKAYNEETMFPFDANLSVPLAFWVIETQLPYILEVIFQNGEFVEVAGQTVNGQVSASSVQAALEYHFTNSFDTHDDMYEFSKQLLMYGTSIYKVFWKYMTEERTFKVPLYAHGEFTQYKNEKREVVVNNNPAGYTVDLFNFLVDPHAPNVSQARFAMEDMWLDPLFLLEKQQQGLFKNVGKVLKGEFDVEANEGLVEREEVVGLESYQKSKYVERGKVHVVDYWGYLGKGLEGDNKWNPRTASRMLHHVLIAFQGSSQSLGDGIVLLGGETPFKHNRLPYVDSRIHHTKGEFYGSGDLEFIESLCLELTDMRNMRLDNLNRTMNRMFTVRDNANIDETELKWRPGGIIHVQDQDDIKVLDAGQIDFSSFRETEEIRRDIEQITGVNDFSSGMFRSSTGFNDTATGISLIQQAALKKVGLKSNVVQRAIRDIAFLTFNLMSQYEPLGTTVRKLMPDDAIKYKFVDVSPEALNGMYDFNIANSASVGNKNLRVQQMIQLLQYMVPLSQQAGIQIDFRAYLKRIISEMDIPNPSELLGYPEFNMELPPELSDSGTDVMFDPETENRMMVEEHRYVPPKRGEPHPQHLVVHVAAFQNTRDMVAKNHLADHIKETKRMMQTERSLLSSALATQVSAQHAQKMLSAGTTESPMGSAGTAGMEDMMRLFANTGAGNG